MIRDELKLIVSVIFTGENVKDGRTPYPFVINDKGSYAG
jgi:hypothetical protein